MSIGVRESHGATVDEALREHLRERTLLLVLDNLEQLLPAGADMVAAPRPRGAPSLRVLVTSRELLRIGGERGYRCRRSTSTRASRCSSIGRVRIGPTSTLDDDDAARRSGRSPSAWTACRWRIELAAARTRLLQPGA